MTHSPGGPRRAALVTGASRGIGRAAAVRLADAGFDVALAARTLEPGGGPARRPDGTPYAGSLQETAAAVRERGRRALALPFDLLDGASAMALVEGVVMEWGRVDVLVNNALYTNDAAQARVLEVDVDQLAPLLEANVTTQLKLAQCAVADMLRRREPGCVINMSSAVSHLDPPAPSGEGGWGFGYAALKAAFARMAPLLHIEHAGDGISAWTLEPGSVPTESFRSAFTDETLEALLSSPDIRLVTEDVPASVVAWLAEAPPAAVALSGQTVDCETVCREHALLPEDRISLARHCDPPYG